jgi:hypothetical protein
MIYKTFVQNIDEEKYVNIFKILNNNNFFKSNKFFPQLKSKFQNKIII